jgi:hypothetical protein
LQEIQRRIIDIAWETHSKLQPGVWAQHLTTTLESCDIVSGWAFQRDGKQTKMSDFSETFVATLLDIQGERDDLIAGDIDVLDAYGLARLCYRLGKSLEHWLG